MQAQPDPILSQHSLPQDAGAISLIVEIVSDRQRLRQLLASRATTGVMLPYLIR